MGGAVSINTLGMKKIFINDGFIQTYQRMVWQEFSPQERLRRSWLLRRRLKNIEKIHDKKIFPQP